MPIGYGVLQMFNRMTFFFLTRPSSSKEKVGKIITKGKCILSIPNLKFLCNFHLKFVDTHNCWYPTLSLKFI